MEIVAALFALHAIECCLWLRRHQVAFVGARKERFLPYLGPHMPFASGAGVLVAAPWHPLALVLVCEPTARRFDVEAIRSRWSAFRRDVRLLSYLCGAAWVYVLAAVPIAIAWRGLVPTWPVLVLGWLGFIVIIAAEFASASRALYPGGDRFAGLAAIVLSPFSAIRACVALSRGLMPLDHPVAVASAMCSDETFLVVARRFYFDADRKDERGDIETFLRSIGRLDDVLQPPRPETVEMRSFCPRCHSQYLKSNGDCVDCQDVAVQPLSARPT